MKKINLKNLERQKSEIIESIWQDLQFFMIDFQGFYDFFINCSPFQFPVRNSAGGGLLAALPRSPPPSRNQNQVWDMITLFLINFYMLCGIIRIGSIPADNIPVANFVFGSLRYDVVYNLDGALNNFFACIL